LIETDIERRNMPNDRVNYDLEGIVFDIDEFAVHDGPGIRTLVYLKGCPLHCLWCHSPESIRSKPQLLVYRSKCIACGACVQTCPKEAQFLSEDGERRIDWEKCDDCGVCAAHCPASALVMCGRKWTVGEVVRRVERNLSFFRNSNGGVTLSGGEVTAQAQFTRNVLQACQQRGIHTAIETCGFTSWNVLEDLAQVVDLFLYDIKHMDSESHRQLTGVNNELILTNLAKLAEMGKDIQVRVPLIPDMNDDEDNIRRTTQHAARLGVSRIALLPYNVAAGSKYEWMGGEYQLSYLQAQSVEQLERLATVARIAGLEVQVGG
jgi:pyruvate formate lyase activating enzyme